MAIKSNSGPPNGRKVMQQALSARLRQGAAARSPLGGGTPQTGSPVPVHHMSLDHLREKDPLSLTTVTSWLYPVIRGPRMGLADVREATSNTGATFGGLSHGTLATRFMEASILAEQQLAKSQEEFTPRLLDVPSLQFAALWLHGSSNDFFISLLDGKPAGTAPLAVVKDVLADLRVRATKRTAPRTPPPTGQSHTPTN